MLNKLKIILLCSALLISCSIVGIAVAQEATDTATAALSASQEIQQDETVTPEELGVQEPTLLPDSKFYFLKTISQKIQLAFTFNPVKKAELNLKLASEKLLEAKKLAEKTSNSQILDKATELYNERVEKIQENIAKFKGTATSSDKISKFLDKYVKQQILHEKILDKLEAKVPTSTLEKIQEAREKHLIKFGEVMQKLASTTQVKTIIQKAIGAIKGSDLKDIKNLEILKNIQDKMPENIKQQIQSAIASTTEAIKNKIQILPPEKQEKIQNYVENIQGKIEKKKEIVNEIKNILPSSSAIKQKFENIKEKLQSATTRKFGNDCVCIEQYNPVCGADAKTYGNPCKAKCQNIAVVSQGPCSGKATTTQNVAGDYKDIKFFRGAFELSGTPLPPNPIKDFSLWLGETKELAFIIKPIADVSNVKINIVLPREIALVDGSSTWSGDVKKDQEVKLPIKIKIAKIGNYDIKTSVSGEVSVSSENAETKIITERVYVVFFGNPSGQGADNLNKPISNDGEDDDVPATPPAPTNDTSGQVPGSTTTITIPTNQ